MPKVLSLPPPSHIQLMFRPALWQALCEGFEVIENTEARHLTPADVTEHLGDCEAIFTGWGAKAFSREILEAAPKLKIVAHTAGSVKGLFSADVVREVLVPRGMVVFSGNDAMAINVAEATIGYMIMAARRWTEHIETFHRQHHGSRDLPRSGQFLTGATVGLVSASKVARHVLRVLQPFDCKILIYDPFLTPETARGLGAELVGLDDLFAQSNVASVHAPALPSTDKMIGAAQLGKLRDGAVFVNTARGAVVDHAALLNECRTGRIVAVLDVTEPEPLPPESEFWNLPNVILTPHIAGCGAYGYFGIGQTAVNALRDCFAGKPVAGAVPLDRWDTLA